MAKWVDSIEFVGEKPKHPIMLIVGVLSFFVVMADFTLLTPAIETVYQHFHETTLYSTVLMSVSITGLISFPTSIVFGMLYDRFGYKRLGLIGILIIALGGFFPFFFADTVNYNVVLTSRIFVGLGLGAVNPVGSALVTRYFYGQTRVKLLGLGNTILYTGATVYSIMAGALGGIGWNYTFLGYLVALVPFVVVLIFLHEPEPSVVYNPETGEIEESTEDRLRLLREKKKAAAIARKQAPKPPRIIYGYIALYFIFCTGNFCVTQLMSTMIAEFDIGSPLIAGFAVASHTIGGMFGGVIFGVLHKPLDKWMLPTLFLAVALSAFGLFLTGNLAAIILFSIVDGIVAPALLSYVEDRIGATCAPERVATMNGVLVGLMNVGQFVGAYYITAVGILFPFLGILGTRLITGILFAAIAVACFVSAARSPRLADRTYKGVHVPAKH